MTAKRLGSEVKRLRIASGLNQSELQQRTGICRSTISLIESGYVQPTEQQARQLSRALSSAVRENAKAVSKIVAEAERLEVSA